MLWYLPGIGGPLLLGARGVWLIVALVTLGWNLIHNAYLTVVVRRGERATQ